MIDLTRLVFGKLTAQWPASLRGRDTYWLCSCMCGTLRVVKGANLINGHSQSCGCQRIHSITKHGHTRRGMRTPEYISWLCMTQRCLNPMSSNFISYGGRGIIICQRWRDSFESFLLDMGKRPRGKTLDRIDTNGNYYKENCRWATPKDQAGNRRK